jgi:hypothetical protein
MSDPSLRHRPEADQRRILEKLFQTSDLSFFEMVRNFPVFTPRYNLARFLIHYELFKKIADLPGVIIDLGVFHGASTFTWAKLCEIFCPTDIKKKVYGFDTFEGFPGITGEDGRENRGVGLGPQGYCPRNSVTRDLDMAREAMNQDRHLRHVNRIEFIKGDAVETIPQFVRQRQGALKIALLNLDMDLFAPTRTALEYFAPCMVRGGIIVVDQYADDNFAGETKAVDEYFIKTTGRRPRVTKWPWHSSPSAFIEVDW